MKNKHIFSHSSRISLWRGICGACPKCGKGRLFKAYLKQNDSCAVCHEDFSYIHADDAPAWLTILLTGHIMMPFIIYFIRENVFPETIEVGLLILMTLLCTLLLLPRAKGLFIAAIWLTQRKTR